MTQKANNNEQSKNFIVDALFCNATPFFLLFTFYSIKIYVHDRIDFFCAAIIKALFDAGCIESVTHCGEKKPGRSF